MCAYREAANDAFSHIKEAAAFIRATRNAGVFILEVRLETVSLPTGDCKVSCGKTLCKHVWELHPDLKFVMVITPPWNCTSKERKSAKANDEVVAVSRWPKCLGLAVMSDDTTEVSLGQAAPLS